MSQITLRGIDEKTEKKIRREAKKKGKSLNKVILEMIGQHGDQEKGKKELPANSLRKLAGGWSQKEADEFLESIKSCEQIDEAMWK
jgi:Holliday junction resolvasome RuvABC DNA-binding subunit